MKVKKQETTPVFYDFLVRISLHYLFAYLQALFVKGQRVTIFSFVGHIDFVSTNQYCYFIGKAATDNA